MAEFDFITDDQFRASLESDYEELGLCIQANTWKAACVLAGSIVEAVLVDYLLARQYSAHDPLKMDLGQAIKACQEQGILTDKTVGLTSAIRLYRNLIHPGRAVRLGEVIDENAARVAQPLVDIVVNEVAAHKQKTYGPTAEQIVAKLIRDPSAAAIVHHLLREAGSGELERLLLRVLPSRFFELLEADIVALKPALLALERCFRSALQFASYDVKTTTARSFVSILKEESQQRVVAYGTAFFRGADLEYLVDEERQLAKDHLLSRLQDEPLRLPIVSAIEGLGQFLTVDEGRRFMDSVCAALPVWSKPTTDTEVQRFEAMDRIANECRNMTPKVRTELYMHLQTWIASLREMEMPVDTKQLAIQDVEYLQSALITVTTS